MEYNYKEEKIKITIPESTYKILISDCSDFNILHKDKTINFNLFLNLLINNYYKEFSNADIKLNDDLAKVIGSDDLNLIRKIIKTFNDNKSVDKKKEKSKVIAFKPTKLTDVAVTYITNHLIKDESSSSYYRRLLINYTNKAKFEREKIIFKENYNLLIKSITKHLQVCLTTKNNKIYKSISVYDIGTSKEEFYNYILINENNNPLVVRLANIENVVILNTKTAFNDELINIYQKQIKYGIQYPITKFETLPVKIKITPKGKKLYDKIYLYRPEYDSIDGDIYTFLGPYKQIEQYFERFGKEAIVLEPEGIRNKMKSFYYQANKEYQKK